MGPRISQLTAPLRNTAWKRGQKRSERQRNHYVKWKKVDLFDACVVVVLNVSVCRPVAITGVLV